MTRLTNSFAHAILFLIIMVSPAHALPIDQQITSPTEGALESSIWFDADNSTVLPVEVEIKTDDSLNRNSRWLPKPKRIKAASNPVALPSGFSISNLLGLALLILFFVLVIGLLALIVAHAETPERVQSRTHSNGQSKLPDEQMAERIKHLPAELRRTDVNLRSEAERLMNAGQFDHAIILLYGHQLLLLDHVGMLRLNRGTTNRKYVREMASVDREASDRLRATVSAFERSYFGRHSISESKFVELWKLNSELESIAQSRTEVAA
jgi:hypothetical protein